VCNVILFSNHNSSVQAYPCRKRQDRSPCDVLIYPIKMASRYTHMLRIIVSQMTAMHHRTAISASLSQTRQDDTVCFRITCLRRNMSCRFACCHPLSRQVLSNATSSSSERTPVSPFASRILRPLKHNSKLSARRDCLVVRDSFGDRKPQKLLIPFRQFTGNDHIPFAQVRLQEIAEQLLNAMRCLIKDDSTALQRDLFNKFLRSLPRAG